MGVNLEGNNAVSNAGMITFNLMPSFIAAAAVTQLLLRQPMNFSADPRTDINPADVTVADPPFLLYFSPLFF